MPQAPRLKIQNKPLALAARRLPLLFILILLSGAALLSGPKTVHAGYYDYNDTILVINDNSATSTAIGNYFIAHRSFPPGNVVHITCSTAEVVSRSEFTNNIRTPIENFLRTNNLASSTNYIILTKDIPIETSDDDDSVDQQIGLILGKYASDIGTTDELINPYYNANSKFSSATYGFYLVTHLEGYTVSGVENLIDHGSNTTTTNVGTFVLDTSPSRGYNPNDGYGMVNEWMVNAGSILSGKGYSTTLDLTTTYLTYQHNVLGYYSWGSNDGNATTTNSIPHNTYVNGAIGDTAVSTSARTFTAPAAYGQSLIADWIAEGISGMQGYVSEPYTGALSHTDILFDRYTDGYNLADSFGMADQYMNWTNLVVGDPKMVIIKTPLSFDVVSPANNSTVGSQSPTFTWNAPTSYYGIAKYQLYIDGVLNTDNIIGTSATPTGNLSIGTHTWYVKAIDTNGGSTTSNSTYTITINPLVVVSSVSTIPTPSTNRAPSFTFSSSKAGTLLFAGPCTPSSGTSVSPGSNTVTFNPLFNDTYSNCAFSVVDSLGYDSATTTLNSFSINAATAYAWGSLAGWVNFAPTYSTVIVSNSTVTGYAWSVEDGWINLSPTNGGVFNNGYGVLSGYAWDELNGWINFQGVTIDSNGVFHGEAVGVGPDGIQNIINFDCANCDVQTGWRPPSSSSGGGGGSYPVTITPVSSLTTPRSLPPSSSGIPSSPPPSTPESASHNPSGGGTGMTGAGQSVGLPLSPGAISAYLSNTTHTTRGSATSTNLFSAKVRSVFHSVALPISIILLLTLAFFAFRFFL
jgi:uncharacterized protein (TIGR03790 family)